MFHVRSTCILESVIYAVLIMGVGVATRNCMEILGHYSILKAVIEN